MHAGVFTVLIGVTHESFPACMCMMILSGIFLEAGCGATYGVVPFVSRRSTGIVCGLVSAGGACGGVINQALFFLNTPAKGAYGEHLTHSSDYSAMCMHCMYIHQWLGTAPLTPFRPASIVSCYLSCTYTGCLFPHALERHM